MLKSTEPLDKPRAQIVGRRTYLLIIAWKLTIGVERLSLSNGYRVVSAKSSVYGHNECFIISQTICMVVNF